MRWLDFDFAGSLDYIWQVIEQRRPVAVARFGDGELALINNLPVKGQAKAVDNWHHVGGESLLGSALKQSASNDNLVHGISCKCCAPDACRELELLCKGTLTFANVFINSNHERFLQKIRLFNRPVCLIANQAIQSIATVPCAVNGIYKVPHDCVNAFANRHEMMRQDMKLLSSVWKDSLILIAAGPLGTVFVHWLQQFNPHIQALDIGSALDQYIFGRDTRRYHKPGNVLRARVCVR